MFPIIRPCPATLFLNSPTYLSPPLFLLSFPGTSLDLFSQPCWTFFFKHQLRFTSVVLICGKLWVCNYFPNVVTMARMNRPAPVEITYKNMRFLITHNPTNATLNKFIEVRLKVLACNEVRTSDPFCRKFRCFIF